MHSNLQYVWNLLKMTSEPFKFAVSKDCDVFEFKDRNIIFETTQAKLREEKAEPARGMELELPHRFRMRARISGHAVSRTCNLAASQNHTLTVSHFLFIFEEPISIIVEPSEKPGCEEIERSKYRDSGRSGKAPSEARDQGTGYCEESIVIAFE